MTTQDADAIYRILVTEDIDYYAGGRWDLMRDHFDPAGCAGRVAVGEGRFETVMTDREEFGTDWLASSAREGVGLTHEEFVRELHAATTVRIDVHGDEAVLHKHLLGVAGLVRHDRVIDYFLRRSEGGRWLITGFDARVSGRDGSALGSQATRTLPAGATPPASGGPYSPVIVVGAGDIVTISGQGPQDAAGNVVGDTIEEQVELTLANCRRQLAAAGCSMQDVWKVGIYLADLSEWSRMNEVYARWFHAPYPTRTTVGVSLLLGMKVEIDMVATRPR